MPDMYKFTKTDQEIRDQILNWFLKYHRQPIDKFDGQESFTPFDKLPLDEQMLLTRVLLENEIPVLILKAGANNTTICTTRRFIHFENDNITELNYKDFDRHTGYKSIAISRDEGLTVDVKIEGYIQDFGLQKTDGQIIYWKIPTGHIGFAFWNITKKFEVIGRKYIVAENK